jgi:hypothetical protein
MRANSTSRLAGNGRSIGLRLGVAVIVAGAVAACTGDNLFTGIAAGVGLLGPEVDITAPQPNLAVTVGDSVTVTANVTDPNGVTGVKFSGTFSGGQVAFTEIAVGSLPSPKDTTMTRVMRQAGTTTGNVRIIVEATNAAGDTGADTVTVIIS